MIQVLSEGLVVLYLTNLFVLSIVYASPYLQTKFKVSSKDVFNAILVTVLYTLSLVALFCVVKKLGISESKLLYTFDGLLWFYLVCLYWERNNTMNVSELIAYLSQFPPTSSVEVKISGFDDSEDGRLNLFGLVNGAIKTEIGYPQLIAEFDTAEPYDWGN